MNPFLKPGFMIPAGAILLLALVALAAPILPLDSPTMMSIPERLSPPSYAHPFGQDEYGRDVLSRVIWGARASLFVAFGATIIAAVIGTLFGVVGGYFSGVFEVLTVRLAELILCLPPMLLALLVITFAGPGESTLVITLALLFAPAFARVAYAQTLTIRSLEYVVAQQVLGTSSLAIVVRTILPNAAPPLVTTFSLMMSSALLLESGLSFLGLGVIPPTPSWGLMIRDARATMNLAPWLLLWPSVALTLTVLLFNRLCDVLQDMLAPQSAQGIARFQPRASHVAREQSELDDGEILSIRGLTLSTSIGGKDVPLVRGASLSVRSGEIHALVGESGSGKTLTALSIMGLLPPAIRVAGGSILFRRRRSAVIDLAACDDTRFASIRGDAATMIFQDPSTSLDPLKRVGRQIAAPIVAHGYASMKKAQERAVDLLRDVQMPDPERRVNFFPHEMSGGQKQRVMIATAIANEPDLIVADEPTTALDVTIQAQVLALMNNIMIKNAQCGVVFITHNLAVVSQVADRVTVMYAGEIVETGPVLDVFTAPRHPYTRALLDSIPEDRRSGLRAIPGGLPNPAELPSGCVFAPRCSFAQDHCGTERPELAFAGAGRMSACLRQEEIRP